MIAIIDYDTGNLKNVYNVLTELGLEAKITSDPIEIDNSEAIILPGVGAYRDAINNLKKSGLDECIIRNVKNGKFILGICLGMQLLFEKSYEDGEWDGLGLLEGEIVKFNNKELKVPHMGWNNLIGENNDELGEGIKDGEYVYFVHSYYLEPKTKDNIIFSTEYGVKVPAVVRKDNIIGMQFHPEKSGKTGYKLLENFKELIK